jgi:hypothetical protein
MTDTFTIEDIYTFSPADIDNIDTAFRARIELLGIRQEINQEHDQCRKSGRPIPAELFTDLKVVNAQLDHCDFRINQLKTAPRAMIETVPGVLAELSRFSPKDYSLFLVYLKDRYPKIEWLAP